MCSEGSGQCRGGEQGARLAATVTRGIILLVYSFLNIFLTYSEQKFYYIHLGLANANSVYNLCWLQWIVQP